MKKILSVVIVLCMACAMLPAFAEEGAAKVSVDSVAALLSSEYAGRVTTAISELGDNEDIGNRSCGSEAEKQAAQLIQDELTAIGFDTVHVEEFTADTWSFNRARVYYTDADGNEQYIPLGGFATDLTFNDEVEVVYVGTGTEEEYESVDVNGKIALIDINQAEDWWVEIPVYEAYTHGALATLVCNVDGYAYWDENTIGSQDFCGPDFTPAFAISQSGSRTLQDCIATGNPMVRLDVDSVVEKNGTSQNIWAEIPGATDEVIYFFAHYDGYYHSFFDDAEGVGSVLAIAKAFKESGYTPDKTLRFVLHGAEEWGKTDTEYDWSAGAYHMIYDLHPEWAENAFAILNIDGMYPVQGHTTFSLASVNELNAFAASIAYRVFEGTGYEVEPKAYTSAWTEDFSYVRKGVPSIVASHAYPEDIYHGPAYHSNMDNIVLGVDYAAWDVVLKLFTELACALDDQAVRPMEFKSHFEAMQENYEGETEIDFESVLAAAEAIDTKIAQLNADHAAAVAAGDTAKATELRAQGVELDKVLYNVYNFITDNFFAFDYEDNLIFTFEMNEWNIDAIETAIELLKEGDGAKAYDEVLYNIDYNWYAYSFSAETYAYMLDKMNNKSAGTWGEGMIRYPGENLWETIHSVARKCWDEASEYTEEIAVLEASLETQKGYQAEIETDLVTALIIVTDLFTTAAA